MDKHTIINLKQQGYSNRSVATMLKVNRKTVAKYWNEFNKNLERLNDPNEDIALVQEKIAAKPKYDTSKRIRRKYTKELDLFIDRILFAEQEKDNKLGINKQHLTNKQIYTMIKNEGYDIGLACISNHLKIKRDKAKECFIKQQYEYGDRLEYDFGEVKLIIAGELNTYHLAVLSSPASNYRWAYLYKNQKNDVFLDSHVKFFDMIGGMYKEIVYDNMKNVVSKFIGRNEKEFHPKLLILSNYYGFNINATNAFSGNEKGHVEGSVKIIRNAVFAERYQFDSLIQTEEYLTNKLMKLNKNSTINEEIKHLMPLKPTFELASITKQKVNSYSFVQVDTNLYSVPDYLVGKTVTVRNYVKEVKFYLNDVFVCKHRKKDGAGEVSIDINHYLTTLARKPGAIRNSTALKSIPMLKSIFDNNFNTNPKKFIELLEENKEKSIDELLDELSSYGTFNSNVIPIDIRNPKPHKSSVESKTKGIILSYNKLCIGGNK